MELFILTVKPIENKYARTLIFFAYFCNKQIPYPVFFVKAPHSKAHGRRAIQKHSINEKVNYNEKITSVTGHPPYQPSRIRAAEDGSIIQCFPVKAMLLP